MSQENVEIVRRAFGVLTIPGDPEKVIAAIDPGFAMDLVAVGGQPAHYDGASGIREFFRDVEEDWESFRFDATDLRDLGDRVLVLGDVHGRGRASGIDVEAKWAYIVGVREGKVAGLRGFLDQGEALEAAGLHSEE